MMKFLIDVNASGAVATWLIKLDSMWRKSAQ